MNDRSLFAAEILDKSRRALAADIVARQLAQQPDAAANYGRAGFPDLHDDTSYRLACLAESVAVERPRLFTTQVEWLHIALHCRGIPATVLRSNLDAMVLSLLESLPEDAARRAIDCIRPAVTSLPTMPTELPGGLDAAGMRQLAEQYLLAVLENRRDGAWQVLEQARGRGVSRDQLARGVIAVAQAEVGRMWQMNQLSIIEEHMASEIADHCLHHLYERVRPKTAAGHRALVAGVGGDLHRLAMRWLAGCFEAAGWDAVFVGADLPAEELPHAVAEFDCDVVCLGATLPLHVRSAANAVAAVRRAPTEKPTAVMVGGAPFLTVPDLWQVIGADATAVDPPEAVAIAAQLVRR